MNLWKRVWLTSLVACGAARAEGLFPAQVATNGTEFELRSTARMKMGGLLSIYDIALYLPAKVETARVLEDVPKRLDIRYLKNLSRSVLIDNGAKGLASNVPPDRLTALQPKVDELNALYQDVKPRDHYTLTYVPGKGTELALNGERRGVVKGEEFAAAYFTIWLGTNAPRPEVRDALLGRTPPR